MPEPIYVLVRFALLFIEILSFAMLIRAILGWFTDGSGRFSQFLYVLTEPVILPIRKLFVKLNWFQDSPIDIAFTFGFLSIWLVEIILGAFLA